MASLDQRLTYADLMEMPDDGTRYELIDGEAYVIPSPNAKHQTVLLELAIRLREAIRDRSTLFIAPLDVVLADDTVLQPDLLLVTPGGRAQIKRGVEGPPDLAVEILSRTSVRRDRGVKRAAYARFGVGEYWLVDLNQQAIEVYLLDPGTKPGLPRGTDLSVRRDPHHPAAAGPGPRPAADLPEPRLSPHRRLPAPLCRNLT